MAVRREPDSGLIRCYEPIRISPVSCDSQDHRVNEETAKLNARLRRQMNQLKQRMTEERRKLEDRSFDPPKPKL